jgi:hemolysin D
MLDDTQQKSASATPENGESVDATALSAVDRILQGGDHGAFSPAVIEIQNRPPAPLARVLVATLLLAVLAFILWSIFSEFEVVISAPGKIKPSSHTKVIQPLENGIVTAIHVRDGQRVRAGEPLIDLDPTSTQADRDRLARDALEARLDVLRLSALVGEKSSLTGVPAAASADMVLSQEALLRSRLAENRQRLAALDGEIARRDADVAAARAAADKVTKTLPMLEQRLQMQEDLLKKGFVSEMNVIDHRVEVSNQRNDLAVQEARLNESVAALSAARQNRVQALAEQRSRALTEMAEATKREQTAAQELIKAEHRTRQQKLAAPADGVVQQLAVHTVGGVVTAAQPLLVVVPEGSSLEVEATVLNKDIGFVKAGQPVVVKIDAFEYTKYGYLNGRIEWVGTDAMQDQRLGLVYPVRVSLQETTLPVSADGQKVAVGPGMAVSADVTVAKRRAWEYFLSPLLRYRAEALRER